MLAVTLYVIIGMLAGLLAGLLGVGGGVIIIPGLVYIFTYLGMPQATIMHMAAGTSLATIIFTTAMATFKQHQRCNIDWALIRTLAPMITIGTICGVTITSFLPAHFLKILFGIFLFFMAARLLWPTAISEENIQPTTPPNRILQSIAGFLLGLLVGLLGVGGGAVAVPALIYFGLSPHKAVANSSACCLLLGIVGTIGFIIIGWHAPALAGGHNIGYVHWHAALIIAAVSLPFVPLGIKLAERLSTTNLKRVFGVFLILVGLDIIFR